MIWPCTEVVIVSVIPAGRLPDVEVVAGLGVGQHDPGRDHLAASSTMPGLLAIVTAAPPSVKVVS